MPLVIPEGFGSLATRFTTPTAAGDMFITCGVTIPDVASDLATDALHAAAQWHTLLEEFLLNRVAQELVMEDTSCTVVDGDGVTGSVTWSEPLQGLASGTDEPWAMAAIVNKQTARLGRPGRGRMFVPGVLRDEEVAGSGVISSTATGNLTATWGVIFEGMANPAGMGDPPDWPSGVTITDRPCVLLHSSASLTPDLIIGGSIAPKVGWIRGRLR